jgi:hypothetical protein
MSTPLTEAQQERISKIETYGHARVGVFDGPDESRTVHVEIIRPGKGASYRTLDAGGRLHDLPERGDSQ